MKYIPIFILFVFYSFTGASQTIAAGTDTLPVYLQKGTFPHFNIQRPDSTWYTHHHLPKKPVLIVYFSPDCGHCQTETETLISNIHKLKKLHIVLITSRPFEDMVNFHNFYRLHKFENIVVGQDPNYYVTRFYNVKFTPFSALYNKKGKLVKSYEQGITMPELLEHIK